MKMLFLTEATKSKTKIKKKKERFPYSLNTWSFYNHEFDILKNYFNT